jgi:putative tricarboxylic transport membrane protein
MAIIGSAGFVLAGAVLFAGVARGFASRRPARDLALGLALSLAVFFFFVRFLNVNLPAGWLKPLLGAAGI